MSAQIENLVSGGRQLNGGSNLLDEAVDDVQAAVKDLTTVGVHRCQDVRVLDEEGSHGANLAANQQPDYPADSDTTTHRIHEAASSNLRTHTRPWAGVEAGSRWNTR